MILVFALIGAFIAFIPGAAFVLIPMEVFLLYKIMGKHNAFDWMTFFGTAATLVGVSTFLKGLAEFLQFIPVLGQLANSAVAFAFIMAFGHLAEKHFSKRGLQPPSNPTSSLPPVPPK